MTISARQLTKWRRHALLTLDEGPKEGTIDATLTYTSNAVLCEIVLKLTRELLDKHLLEG